MAELDESRRKRYAHEAKLLETGYALQDLFRAAGGPSGVFYVPKKHTRDVGEQPEPAPVSVVGCPYCQRVPCEAPVAHRLWRAHSSGEDV
jgi:hypothetical protein